MNVTFHHERAAWRVGAAFLLRPGNQFWPFIVTTHLIFHATFWEKTRVSYGKYGSHAVAI